MDSEPIPPCCGRGLFYQRRQGRTADAGKGAPQIQVALAAILWYSNTYCYLEGKEWIRFC